MHFFTVLVGAAVALWAVASASPLLACDNDGMNKFVADDRSLCVFYQCVFGRAHEFACAKGSRVPSYFTKSPSSPCIIKVKTHELAICNRYNVTDGPIPDAKTSNQCAQFQPCDSKPGCTCVDQVSGYYCSCSPSPAVVPTPDQTPVQECDINICLNGGTCYSLYKNKFCNCKPPYTGKFCEADACDEMACNNGACVFNRFGVYCQCDPCYTGHFCEDVIKGCNCTECIGGINCTTLRFHLCKCNPCLNEDGYCINGQSAQHPRSCVIFERRHIDFTLMFVDNDSDPPFALEVYVSAKYDDGAARLVTVVAPLLTYSVSAVIPPGITQKFIVHVSLKHAKTGKENLGIRVREINGKFLNVYCVNRAAFSAGGWLALPDAVAGHAFIVISYWTTGSASIFSIVAIHNNTFVSINLASGSEDIPNSEANTTLYVNLNAWQTYLVKSITNDLTGSRIISNKPIHVYSGATRAWVGPSPAHRDYDPYFAGNSSDTLILECTSVETWGKTYALVPLPRANLGYPYTEEAARIISDSEALCKLYATTDDALHFTESTIILSSHQRYFAQFYVNAEYNYFLSCDQPVMFVEITESTVSKYSLYNDASFIYVPAVYSYSNYFSFVPPLYSATNGPYYFTYLRLIAEATDYMEIQVNDKLLASMDVEVLKKWTPIYVPNAGSSRDLPNLYGCILRISSNDSTMVNHPRMTAKFSAIVEGYDHYESYGIVLGSISFSQPRPLSSSFLQSSSPVVSTAP